MLWENLNTSRNAFYTLLTFCGLGPWAIRFLLFIFFSFFPLFLCYPRIAPCLGTDSRGLGLRASSHSWQPLSIEPWASPPQCPEKPSELSRQGVCQGWCLEQCTCGVVLVLTLLVPFQTNSAGFL